MPEGLTELLVGLGDRYGERLPPIQITENGCSQDDRVVDGTVDNPGRIRYLEGHLHAVLEAIEAGVDVDGYFCWSLLDNFESAEGRPAVRPRPRRLRHPSPHPEVVVRLVPRRSRAVSG